MILNLLLLFVGFIVLIKGADIMINGAASLAQQLKISRLTIGLSIVAFGTSAPELTVNVFSTINGRNDAIFGNVLGSNIFNLLLILGATGIIYPLAVQKSSIRYEVPLSLLAAGILYILVNDSQLFGGTTDQLSRTDAAILLGGFLLFMYYIYHSMRNHHGEEGDELKQYSSTRSVVMVIAGLGMLIGGGYLVTENAVAVAQDFGLSEKLIGLTILAVGTSLPELVTCLVAAYRRNVDIAVGNVIGSNLFNIFFILGISGSIRPLKYSIVLNTDFYVLGGATVFLLISMFTLSKNKLDRGEAAILLLAYIVYTVYLILRN